MGITLITRSFQLNVLDLNKPHRFVYTNISAKWELNDTEITKNLGKSKC